MTTEKIETITEIDSVKVSKLVQEFGSPLFVFSEATLRARYLELKNAFDKYYPNVTIAWPYKTNYLDAVCRVFHDEGAWAEVVSGFEYDKAVNNNVPGDKIVFNGPYKLQEDLIRAVKNNSLIHLDNFDEIKQLAEIVYDLNIRARVAVRVNLNAGIKPAWQRFGFNYENNEVWQAITEIFENDNFQFVGLHTHMGMQIVDTQAYVRAVKILGDIADRIYKKWNVNIEYIDFGGGFASKNYFTVDEKLNETKTPSFNHYAEAIGNAVKKYFTNSQPKIMLETGRALVEDSAYLIGTVLSQKILPNDKHAIVVDAGINLVFMNQWYVHKIYPASKGYSSTKDLSILGPLCMNIDVLRQSIDFPFLNQGEHIVIKRVGAYNVTRWMQFITYRPAIVMIDTIGNTHIIRKKETIENFTSMESSPSHL